MSSDSTSRVHPYRPSGAVRWDRFLPGAVLSLLVAIVMGSLLHQVNLWGLYLIVVAPLIAVLPVAGLVSRAVSHGHCRNVAIATSLGVLAGLLLYLSYYHSGLVSVAGLRHIKRIDVLPFYIWFRLHTDVIREVHRARNVAGGNGDLMMNFVMFALELGLLVFIGGSVALERARRPYDEIVGRWLNAESVLLVRGTAQIFLDAFQTNALRDFIDGKPARVPASPPFTRVTVYYSPPLDGMELASPAFLTIEEVEVVESRKGKKGGLRTHTLLKQAELSAEDVDTLVSLFPTLAAGGVEPVAPEPAAPGAPARSVAEVWPVPEEFSGKVLSGRNLLIANLYVLSPLLLMVIGFAFFGLGIWLGEHKVEVGPLTPAALTVAGIGLAVTTWIVAAILLKPAARFGNRHLYRAARSEFQWRTDRMVDPDDPATLFVEMIPRRNFNKLMVETATDVGFLALDTRQRLILFDGDRERFRIPFDALESFEVEQFRLDLQNPKSSHYGVVLRATLADGVTPWEAPLALRYDAFGNLMRKNKQERAEELRRRIESALGPVGTA